MTLSLTPHRFAVHDGEIDAELGVLTVPMNRSRPGAGTVGLSFVRLPRTGAHLGPPIVFLCGGPGISGIRFARGRAFPLLNALRASGDVILLDQRGSGLSTPSLNCSDAFTIPSRGAPSRDDALHATIDATRGCAQQLEQSGVDLSAFNTNESADDVADLARALGAEQVTLLGWSYGTHLAFAVMRRHGELVARAVLAGPEGPDHTYKLPSRIQLQLESIAERARATLPGSFDFLATMRAVLESVERAPAPAIGRFELEWMTAEGIGDVRMIARLPQWYARMARGDYRDLADDPLLRSYYEELRGGRTRSIVRTCMDCASGASPERWRRIEAEARTTLLGRTIDFPFPEVCEAVGRPDLGDAYRAPIRSSTPVLFVTGTWDARTPAENVADLAPGFANSRHLVIDDAGHVDLLFSADATREIVRFVAGGEIEHERVAPSRPFRFDLTQPVLLYDGDCGFCRQQVERLRRRAGSAISFEAYQSAHWHGIPETDLAREVHFVDEKGNVSRGAEAVLRARAAGGGGPLLWMYRRFPPFAAVADAVYRWVARNRGRIGRGQNRG